MQVNFDLEYTTSACPHKHDLGLSVPNEFAVLPPDTMVVAVFRWAHLPLPLQCHRPALPVVFTHPS